MLDEKTSISAVARHYRVAFLTARSWMRQAGLGEVLASPNHRRLLGELIADSAKAGTRNRVDSDLTTRLHDQGDRKLLARAIVDEFYIRYSHKKCGLWEGYALTLRLTMYDEPPVRQIAELVGRPFKMRFRKSKSGVRVPFWDLKVEGYRAYKIVQLVSPFLVGQKAFQAGIALRVGPISKEWVPLKKEEYKRNMLESTLGGLNVPALWLREGSRTSLAPERHAV